MSLQNALWLAPFPAEAIVIGLLFYRRTWRTLPIFCAYCIWEILINAAAFAVIRYYPAAYFHFYFGETILDSILQFCVLVELAWSVLRPVRASLSPVALVVMAGLILALGAAIWPFAALPGLAAHVTSRQWLLLTQLEQTVSILRILFFLLLTAGSQLLSISWRDRELQVATGLGLYSLVALTAAMVHLHQTTASQYQHLFEVVIAGNLCCLLYWAVSFAQKEAARRAFTPQMQSLLLSVAGAARSTRIALGDSHAAKPRESDNR